MTLFIHLWGVCLLYPITGWSQPSTLRNLAGEVTYGVHDPFRWNLSWSFPEVHERLELISSFGWWSFKFFFHFIIFIFHVRTSVHTGQSEASVIFDVSGICAALVCYHGPSLCGVLQPKTVAPF